PGVRRARLVVIVRALSLARITRWGDGGCFDPPDQEPGGTVDCGPHVETADSAEAGDAREIERRYRALVEQLPLVVYVDALDESSSNIFTSEQIEPLLGYPVGQWRDDPDLFVRTLH